MEVHVAKVLRGMIGVGAGALACTDTAKLGESSNAGITAPPSFTVAVGFTPTVLARGNLGTYHIQSKAGDYDAELKSHDNTDIVVVKNVVTPGGHSGWHFHPGPVLVTVASGTITFYMGDDPTCTAHVHPAGTTFFENSGRVGIAPNQRTRLLSRGGSLLLPPAQQTPLG